MYDHYFSNFCTSPTPKDYAKIQPQGILGSIEVDF